MINAEIEKVFDQYLEDNKRSKFDPFYGVLMLDRSNGEMWVDEFNDLGHNQFNIYHSAAIIDLGREIEDAYMSGLIDWDEFTSWVGAKKIADKLCADWQEANA